VLELLSAQGLLEQSDTGIGDREATIELATGDVDINGLFSQDDHVSHSFN
jgi:hypothetical protein